ncbi:MAG: exo-alpha-sialidase, partial [Victivallales bacterium]|nr:exo-alpha-sialidase [Victivallales bacterium]
MRIEILDQGMVASRPGQMYAWPGITKTADGAILVSASERKVHVGPYGREVIMRSDDDGGTWSLPRE